MGTQLIIELDILRHAFAVALLRGVLPAVRLLFFEGSKERFGDRVVMGPCCSGKGLFRTAFLNEARFSNIFIEKRASSCPQSLEKSRLFSYPLLMSEGENSQNVKRIFLRKVVI